jgi:DNA invertase Pin-like site-specific DNA recombinase
MNNPLTKREIESLADQLLALLDQIDSGDLRATPGMRHRIEGALIGLDIALGRSLEETLDSFRGLDKRAE